MFTKQALSIGIKDYSPSRLVLEPCIHDATDLSNSLRSIGFRAKCAINLDLSPMKSIIHQFVNSIQPNAIVMFYFSGHGVECDGINYLIPRNATGISAANIKSTAIDAQQLIDAIYKKNPRLIICVLDCCREYPPIDPVDENSPFKRTLAGTRPGLAPMRAPPSTIIVYACAAYEAASAESANGRNSLYTYHLLRYIRTPNVDIETVLRCAAADCQRDSNNEQIPYRYSSCNEIICLASNQGYKALVSPQYMQTRPIVQPLKKQRGKALAVHHSQPQRNNVQHQLNGHFGLPMNNYVVARNPFLHMKRIPWGYGFPSAKESQYHRR